MSRFDQALREAKEAMVAAGQLPKQIMPARQRVDTNDFFADIYWSAVNGGEYVAKLTYRNAEDLGRTEEVRARSRDALMLELMRQNAKLKVEEQELSAPARCKTQMRLSDYESPEDMVTDVIQSAAARQWLQTPVGQQYVRLEKVCSNSRVFEIWKRSMEELGYWLDPALWTVPNLNHAFILGFDRGDYKSFERKADTQSTKVDAASNVDKDAEYDKDAMSPFLHINTISGQPDEIQTERELPLSELRRKAYAQRFANQRSR
jgi:hypothetical protein